MPGATPLHELEAYLPRSSVPNIDRDSATGGFLCTSNYGGTANASPASTRMASITGVDSPTAAAAIMTQRRNTRGQLERDPLLASGLVRGHTSAAQVVPAASAVIHATPAASGKSAATTTTTTTTTSTNGNNNELNAMANKASVV